MRLFAIYTRLMSCCPTPLHRSASTRKYLLNIQIEKLENHVARLTIEIETSQLDQAKRKAAKKIARQVNIPGFRKGKAPYKVLVQYLSEAPILEEAVEQLGNEIYKQALDESEVEPYTSGTLEDFKLDPSPTFVFSVPMQPTVELNDYTQARVEYTPKEVTDEEVNKALRQLQEEHAVVEEIDTAAIMGNKVTIDVHGFFTDEETDEENEEEQDTEDVADEQDLDESGDDDHDTDEADADDHLHDAPIHQHDAEIYLDTEREPVPGFADALVGVQVNDEREFTITYPEDEEQYGSISGREVRFVTQIKKVEAVNLPQLNDDFAARVTNEEEEPLTLLQLRGRLRENLQAELDESYRSEYVEKVLDQLVTSADFAYPDAMVHNQIESMIENTAQQVGLSVEDYTRILQKSVEDFYDNPTFREAAERYVERSLVMRGILDTENIDIEDTDIDSEIDQFLTQFGEQAETYRSLFNTPAMRENMRGNLLERKVLDRIVAIGRGEVSASAANEESSTDATDEPESSEDTSPENIAEPTDTDGTDAETSEES